MKHPALAVLLAVALLSTPGCHTLLQATNHDQGPAVFGGTRLFSSLLPATLEFPPIAALFLLDFPLTLAADLVLLPVSIPWEIHEGGIKAVLFPKGVIPH